MSVTHPSGSDLESMNEFYDKNILRAVMNEFYDKNLLRAVTLLEAPCKALV